VIGGRQLPLSCAEAGHSSPARAEESCGATRGDRVRRGRSVPHAAKLPLSGDPFIDAQDWEVKGLAIDLKEGGPARAVANVTFTNFGEARHVRLDLIKTAAGWRIDDIHWRQGSLRGLYKK